MVVPHEVKSPNYPSPPTTDILRQAITDITHLISLTITIRIFSVKWQLIRAKLDQLNSALIAADNHPSSASDPLRDLVSSVVVTVADCRDLATRCMSLNFSGKLLMQSDLDLIISRLDHQLKQLFKIITNTGIVSNGFALVASMPGVGAARDDMRFYIKDLLTRVKIGDCEMKRDALVCLNEAVTQDERYVKHVIEMDDFVTQLGSFLCSSDLQVQQEASIAVDRIARLENYRAVLVGSGVIGSLIRVIEMGTLKAKENAIRCLRRLTEGGENAWAFSAHGGVTSLLGICTRENDELCLGLVGLACWVLRNVVIVEEIKRFMIEQGVVQICIKLIKGKDELGQIGSVELIQTLAVGDEFVRNLVVKDGGIRAMTRIVDPKSTVSFKLRETALRAIENLCFSRVDYVNMIISYGFMDNLLYFLRKGDVSMQELAFKSASRLCVTSEEARKTMGDVGFIPEFVRFLEAKSYEIREMAAEALACVVLVHKNRKKFSQEDHNIGLVLQLIDPKEGNSGNFKFLLSILLSLSSCNHARKRISSSGYVKNIEKLADSGVSDAKKIVRKLSTNKFRSMLSGIWHS